MASLSPEALVGELDPLIELATKDAPGGKLDPCRKRGESKRHRLGKIE